MDSRKAVQLQLVSSEGVQMKREANTGMPAVKLIKICAGHCEVSVGDRVISDTTVGRDFTTREPLHAGCAGVVEAVNWSAEDHAYFVWVRPSQSSGAEHGSGAI
jgi:hypothetical protein